MTYHRPTREAAAGQWRGILLSLGVPSHFLRDKHGPCPFCGGTDRFRFDNKAGSGSFICSQCGAGSGMDFAERFLGCEFKEAAARVDQVIHNTSLPADKVKPQMDEAERRERLRSLWRASQPVQVGDLADAYFKSRGLGELIYSDALRFAPKVQDGEGGIRPCLLAVVTGADGKPATIHRTFLRSDGKGKAEMASPRKMMPGDMPDAACVRLTPPATVLGIAEGIETAFAASALWDVPVWAAINANLMAKWSPPPETEEVVIFGDNDPKFGGQAAAYALAHRLACKGIDVTIQIPRTPGHDWLDEYELHSQGELE